MRILVTSIVLLASLLCFGCDGEMESQPSCDIGEDKVAESKKDNYDCESTPGCEWKALGGRQEMQYACCPESLSCEGVGEGDEYWSCCIIID